MEPTKTRDDAISKLLQLSPEQVTKVLIFMAGLDAAERLNPNGLDKQERAATNGETA